MLKLLISAENAEFQIIHSLKNNRVKRSKLGEAFIEGIESIKQAINAGVVITRVIIREMDKLSDWAKTQIGILSKKFSDVKIIEMSDELFRKLSSKEELSEMLLTVKIKHYSLDDITEVYPFLLLIDRPSDHGNLGAIIRSANAFCVNAILLMGHGVDAHEAKVIRASMGGIFFTRLIHVESMEELSSFISAQKARCKMVIAGTDSGGDLSLSDVRLKRPIMLIIGNEAKGMSKSLKEVCNNIVSIPLKGNVNSLNVSSAASILIWEVYKNGG